MLCEIVDDERSFRVARGSAGGDRDGVRRYDYRLSHRHGTGTGAARRLTRIEISARRLHRSRAKLTTAQQSLRLVDFMVASRGRWARHK